MQGNSDFFCILIVLFLKYKGRVQNIKNFIDKILKKNQKQLISDQFENSIEILTIEDIKNKQLSKNDQDTSVIEFKQSENNHLSTKNKINISPLIFFCCMLLTALYQF